MSDLETLISFLEETQALRRHELGININYSKLTYLERNEEIVFLWRNFHQFYGNYNNLFLKAKESFPEEKYLHALYQEFDEKYFPLVKDARLDNLPSCVRKFPEREVSPYLEKTIEFLEEVRKFYLDKNNFLKKREANQLNKREELDLVKELYPKIRELCRKYNSKNEERKLEFPEQIYLEELLHSAEKRNPRMFLHPNLLSYLDRHLQEIGDENSEKYLPVRVCNVFDSIRICYVGELVQKTESDLLRVKHFGRKSLKYVKEYLAQLGLQLGMKEIGEYWVPPAED